MATFKLKIVTPAGVAVEEQVASVTVPAIDGEIGILPQHTQYAGILGSGVLSYATTEGGTPTKLVVCGGCCQFANETLTVLADSCDLPDGIDKASYGKERTQLQKIVDTEDTASAPWIVAREKLSRIEAIDNLIG